MLGPLAASMQVVYTLNIALPPGRQETQAARGLRQCIVSQLRFARLHSTRPKASHTKKGHDRLEVGVFPAVILHVQLEDVLDHIAWAHSDCLRNTLSHTHVCTHTHASIPPPMSL